jgi:hypothetical protein
MRHDNGGAVHNATPDALGKDADLNRDVYPSSVDDSASELSEKQAGVKRIEGVSKAWTKTSLIIAYVA